MKYRKKPEIVEAITFDEFIEYGIEHGGNVNNGMPWSFEYRGYPVTHEDDNCYLITTSEGSMKFFRDMLLVTDALGKTKPWLQSYFEARYEPMEEDNDRQNI